MHCDLAGTVHTIGHSTRTQEVLVALLREHNVQMIVDVRRWPASRRYPHFHREALAANLSREQIAYVWRGDLGGFRKPSADSQNTAWKIGAFRAYADFMLTPEFERIMGEMELLARKRIAIMCAEAVPWRCHRQLLADALLVRGFPVSHIVNDGCQEHRLPPFAIPEGTKIFYPASPQYDLTKQG
ncbi:MAG TPA: DUF488 domain-containing protein [Candidatus Binatia bacterium]|nr:DUF488 domain-containing protein [Candidatus Binatia bacterium]